MRMKKKALAMSEQYQVKQAAAAKRHQRKLSREKVWRRKHLAKRRRDEMAAAT